MKKIRTLSYLLVLLLTVASIANSEHYYCRLGQIYLVKSDSIVNIKFNSGIPGLNIGTFAERVECLDETYPPEQEFSNFWTYHIEDGYDIDTAIVQLDSMPEVKFAFPAYEDSMGFVKKINDVFIISFNDTVSQNSIDSMYSFYNVAQIEGPFEYTGTRKMNITSESPGNTLEIANAFYESGLVKYSQPAMFKFILNNFEPDDPLFLHQYYLHNENYAHIDINIKKAWEITTGNPEVVVAVIDAGCVQQHEDLNGSNILWNWGYDYIGSSCYEPSEDSDPSPGIYSGHGVACQGIISGETNNSVGISGIAPDCRLIPIRIFDDDEYGSWDNSIPEKAIRRAINYFKFYKSVPMVISCSWGYVPSDYVENVAAIIDTAVLLGIPVVFSSGNFGEYDSIGATICFPAKLETTIGVGAIARDGGFWLYSGSGSGMDVVAPSGHTSFYHGDMYALDQPGDYGYNPFYGTCDSTTADYMCFFGGTSGACPQVSGTLALVRSRRPDISSFDTLKMIIDSSAVDGIGDWNDEPGYDWCYGYGLVNALRALLSVVRGDANNDGETDMLDILYIKTYLYDSGPPPEPDILMADADCSAAIDMLDILYLIAYLYHGGPAPPICFEYGD